MKMRRRSWRQTNYQSKICFFLTTSVLCAALIPSRGRFFDRSTLPTFHFDDTPYVTESVSLSGREQIFTETQEVPSSLPHEPDGASLGRGQGDGDAGRTFTSSERTKRFALASPQTKSLTSLADSVTNGYSNAEQSVVEEGQLSPLWMEKKPSEIEESRRTINVHVDSTASNARASQLESPNGSLQQEVSQKDSNIISPEPQQSSLEGNKSITPSSIEYPTLEQPNLGFGKADPFLKAKLGNRSELPEHERARDQQLPSHRVSETSAGAREGEIDSGCLDTVGTQVSTHKSVDVSHPGFPSTPDEQLRLEEAQSLQLSKDPTTIVKEQGNEQARSQSMQAPANISSHFGQDGDEGDRVVGIRISNDGNGFRPAGPSNELFNEHDRRLGQPPAGLRDQTFPGMTGNLSKDLTFSRRPPMRIDTGILPTTDQPKSLPGKRTLTPSTANPYTPSTAVTPYKSGPLTSHAQSPPERMTTRVSSGALRHKSVSEILGETPKSVTHHGEKGSLERAMNDIQRDDYAVQTPRSASSIATPDTAVFKVQLNELREKDSRSKLSTVVFARPPPSNLSRHSDSAQAQRSEAIDHTLKYKDYLLPLFAAQASTPPHSQPLHSLIASAHKTLTTANRFTDFHEQQDCRMLNKIYQLQYSNRWSLRQVERSVEPERATAHWDVLLSHAKWMRTDFREERKWKIAAAKSLADFCALWVASCAERRRSMQVKNRAVFSKVESRLSLALTPDLIPSTEDDSSDVTEDDIQCDSIAQGTAPAAIFSLAPDMFVFGLEKTPATGKLLQELPLYQPSLEIQDAALRLNKFSPDSIWMKSVVPISRFTEGKMITHEQGPARKRSRYNYHDSNDSDQEHNGGIYSTKADTPMTLDPEQEDVALFDPENKHIRDRIHAGHAFRPPTEHPMPLQNFFESRQSSQWTQGEDDELRKLVREYSYNWSLISSCLSSPSIFSSGAERRTPWECFERWVGLEGLPAEMSKTGYFRAYHSRLQAAQRTHEAQQQAIQQHQGHNTPHMPMRRRTTQPYLVDRRKNVKHLHLVDAMRKLAKKRETALQKQQHGLCPCFKFATCNAKT